VKFLGIIMMIGLTTGIAFLAAAAAVITRAAGSTFVYPLPIQWAAAAKKGDRRSHLLTAGSGVGGSCCRADLFTK
jgi:ABC-type phosphate transport system substrate-binding protein